MNAVAPSNSARRCGNWLAVLTRWVLGGLFVYMGLNKALHPVDFLKLLHQYDLTHTPLLLNLVAAGLPWFEIYCGALLLLGVGVRGTAVLLLAMLIPFTIVVLRRALAIHAAGDIAFCAIKFDCGCGNGEVFICRKLVENSLMMIGAAFLAFHSSHHLCLRGALFKK